MGQALSDTRAIQLERFAGMAVLVLALAGLLLVLFAPIIPVCQTAVGATCVGGGTRHTGLVGAQADAGAWVVIVLPCLIACAAGLAAIADAQRMARWQMLPLGVGVALGLLVCTVAATGTLAVYVPAELAVMLAGYGAVLRRWHRKTPAHSSEASGG